MNKPLKIILLVLAALVLLVAGYLAYVLIDYHRLGDMDLEVDREYGAVFNGFAVTAAHDLL